MFEQIVKRVRVFFPGCLEDGGVYRIFDQDRKVIIKKTGKNRVRLSFIGVWTACERSLFREAVEHATNPK